ncbi:tRNA uridine 5-oxyacetic acid(34) methyltransferase CmoM [Vibrio gallicus]|uniref:tRNA uridine 5-oxyacetic acid(34) methyltransferase CmoM n=1 Tax=Vibrio gallicus TaxID=190897 RepID=UPI0021C29C89|nr:tRNA uridine 5-oxyacetic acid(34) methyltransferase CmoM [Vibrio gallicus]
MTKDRNFDNIAHKFAQNIYGSDKGNIRQTVVWEDLNHILSQIESDSKSLTVVDAGGGLAQMSQKLAKLGHKVILCDVSSEMLALAKQEIVKQGLLEQYTFIHAPIQELHQHIDEPVDLILFHAVMEWLAEPEAVLKQLMTLLVANGMASIMFYNQHGLVMKNVVCGNIPHVLQGMPHRKRFKLQPQKGLIPTDVYQWLEESGLTICGKSGIRCFHDYVGFSEYVGEYTPQQLLELEQQLCRTEPYLSMGRYIHVWVQK